MRSNLFLEGIIVMKKILFLLVCGIFISSCTVTLGENSPPREKTTEEKIDDLCAKGNQEACTLAEEIQQKKEQRYQRIIKESGIRSK